MTDEAEAGMNQRQREINERMQAGGIAQRGDDYLEQIARTLARTDSREY
jgi:hypothetical protein